MKYLGIIALLVWSTTCSTSSIAAPPAAAPLQELFDAARYEEFVPLAERMAATGDAQAQFLLAQAYHLGNGVDEDLRRAVQLYEKGARNGNWRAMHSLGVLSLDQHEAPEMAAAQFQRALEMGGGDQVRNHLHQARWKLCMEEGKLAACTFAAQAYATEWERTRTEDALDKAVNALGALCELTARPGNDRSGQSELPPLTACADAIALAERGAAAGSPSATHVRALLAGMLGDDQSLLVWLQRAADAGNVKSSQWLGDLYAEGRVVPVNREQARTWYEKASAGGSEEATGWLSEYWEAAAQETTDRDKVRQALDELVRLNPEETRESFEAAARLAYLDMFAHNAQHGPGMKEPLARAICVPDLEGGRAHAWTIHALNGPDAEHGDSGSPVRNAQGRTGKSGCLNLTPDAARNIHAVFARGETPLLEVAGQHYILVLGPSGGKVRKVTPTLHAHLHQHDCGCGHSAQTTL